MFIISDTHFGHDNMCKFVNEDGTKVRDFASAAEVDELMIENWNRVVKPADDVYHLGDVVIARRFLNLVMPRLNGVKRLMLGNHDIFDVERDYLPHFKRVAAYHVMPGEGMILSHIPIVMNTERFKWNIHGHTHAQNAHGKIAPDPPRYFNASVERINYTPLAFEDLKVLLRARL